jgi:hypothetical protein
VVHPTDCSQANRGRLLELEFLWLWWFTIVSTIELIEGRKQRIGPYRLEKSLEEPGASCDGEPAPDREAPAIFEAGFIGPEMP